MPEFRIDIDLGGLVSVLNQMVPDYLPHLEAAVQHIAERGHLIWLAYAGGAPLPDGSVINSRSGAYLRSIQMVQTGPFGAELFTDLPYADVIENGAPARDLKRLLGTSLKVRLSKSGHRYLIIPFRWGTPGAVTFGRNVMPPEVHTLWRDPTSALTPSRVVGMGRRVSGTGAYDVSTRQPLTVPQRKYHWGGRLTVDMLKGAGVHGQAAKRMAGMVNMQNPAGEGGGKHSQYLTFRVMSERSSGWLVPAQPGKHPARATADRLRPVAEKVFGRAIEADIKQKMGVA